MENRLNLGEKIWGEVDGKNVKLYTLHNGSVSINVSNYGGIVQAFEVKNTDGTTDNIVAGYATPAEYEADKGYYLGALVGRYANRIADGKFSVDGEEYTLPVNNGPNSLHGGVEGFNRKIWTVLEEIVTDDEVGVIMEYASKDGEEGYPGHLMTEVTYKLDKNNRFTIHYVAYTDKATPISLTNHSYFNLNGFKSDVTNHELKIYATEYTKKNENNVPVGELETLTPEHPLYFGAFKKLKDNMDKFPEDKGFDHNYVLTMQPFKNVKLAAELKDVQSGRQLNVYTDQPGLQIYAGNWWDGTRKGLHDKAYAQYGGLALETQAMPNSPNVASFPNSILRPNERYISTTVYELKDI